MKKIGKRIEAVIAYKKITSYKFCKDVGIVQANLAYIRLAEKVSTKLVNSIVNAYPEISVEWLVTGSGNMLVEKASSTKSTKQEIGANESFYKKLVEEKDRYISVLQRQIEHYNSDLKGVH